MMRTIDTTEIARLLPAGLGEATPGYALAVIDGDEVQTLCQGLAVLEHAVPITPDTAFRIASLTKHFLSLVTLICHDRRIISLDADLGAFVPELGGAQAQVTIRQALQNCSGIRDHLELAVIAGSNLDQPVSLCQSLGLIAGQRETNFPPGSGFLYSNANFLLVTLALERATGQGLGTLLDDLVFSPNGLTSTRYQPRHSSVTANLATGYLREETGFARAEMMQELTGDGAVISTLNDLIRWYRYLRADPDGLIARLSEPTRFSNGVTGHYALGLFNRPYRGVASFGHSGLWPGYRTDLVRFKALDLGLICLSNLDVIDPTWVTRSLAGALLPDSFAPPRAQPDATALDALTAAQGFVNKDSLEFAKFRFEGGRLMVDFGGWVQPADIVDATTAHFPLPVDYLSVDWSEVGTGIVHLVRINGTRLSLLKLDEQHRADGLRQLPGTYRCPELGSTLKIEKTGDDLRASLRGPFAHRPAWGVTVLTNDICILSDNTAPWPRRLALKRQGTGLLAYGFRVKKLQFEPVDQGATVDGAPGSASHQKRPKAEEHQRECQGTTV